MSKNLYQPYEELKVQLNQNTLTLQTPWTEIQAQITGPALPRMESICSAINKGEYDQEPLISEFLGNFEDHYVAYSTPRKLLLNKSHCSQTPKEIGRNKDDSPQIWLRTFAPAISSKLPMAEKKWSLNIENLSDSCRIQNQDAYDPVSAFRRIMHWALNMAHNPNHTKYDAELFSYFAEMRTEDEAAFYETAKYYIRQCHHVTSTSFDCLVPAIESMPFAEDLIRKLVREEYGHGVFTASSLKELGATDPTHIPLAPTAVAIMDMLKYAAHLNPLAFSCLFNLFELPGEQAEDPLAILLENSNKEKSANGIAAHFKLNKEGAHFTNGIFLVKNMEAVDAYTILEAARFAEIHFMLHEIASKEILQYGKNHRKH